MAYFNELPNLQYTARFPEQSSNEDVVLVKNIFRRGKLREDIAEYVTAFDYFYIQTNERPDQIAEKVYGDPELDWVVLITNNIIDFNSELPLMNDNFYNYLIDKYGSETVLDDTAFYETLEVRDEYDRLLVPQGLVVDPDSQQQFITEIKTDRPLDYTLGKFPIPDELYPSTVTTTLGQYIPVFERDLTEAPYSVTDIRVNEFFEGYRQYFSFLKVYDRDNTPSDVYVENTLSGWPSTWGGKMNIYNRDGTTTEVMLPSAISENTSVDISNDSRLYTITSYEDPETNTKTPVFRFNSIN